jgi:hypothetical protein
MLQTAPLHRLYRAAGQRSCRRWRAGRERANPMTQAGEIIECGADNFIGGNHQLAERMSRSPKSLKNWMLQRPEQSRSEILILGERFNTGRT